MRLAFLLALLPLFAAAQSDFLKDPDIVWAAAIEQDWVVDVPSLEDEWVEGITTLKLLRTPQNEANWANPYLSNLVFRAVFRSQLPIFKDPRCTQPADWSVIFSFSDQHSFNPETEEETVQIGCRDFDLEDVKTWRLRQVLAYHRKGATWSTTVESIAPIVAVKNEDGDSVGTRALFWFRPDDHPRRLQSKHIVWAKKTVNRQPETSVEIAARRPLKISDGFQNPLPHTLKTLENDLKTPFYGILDEKPLSPAERKRLLTSQDSIITFDPETYEEKVVVVNNEINADDIRELRLVQRWYWDERRARLSICLDAVAPLMDVHDDNGNFRYQKPLFYRRVRPRR